nr:Zinc finger HIT domain containing protein 1 [Hymenolepis microstoma]
MAEMPLKRLDICHCQSQPDAEGPASNSNLAEISASSPLLLWTW